MSLYPVVVGQVDQLHTLALIFHQKPVIDGCIYGEKDEYTEEEDKGERVRECRVRKKS